MDRVKLSLDDKAYNSKPNAKEIVAIQGRIAKNSCDIELHTAACMIGAAGYSFCPGTFLERRCKADFIEMQLFALDFDDGTSYEEIKGRADELNIPICFAYHTFSSNEEWVKFRVVFLHDCSINNIDIAELVIEMLMYVFPECDKSCSDASRLFLGGKGLIDYAKRSFSILELKNIYQMLLKRQDASNHYARTVERLGKRHRVLSDKNGLMIFENKPGVKFVSPNVDILGDVAKSTPEITFLGEDEQYVIFCGGEGGHQKNTKRAQGLLETLKVKKRRFSAIKYASECCRLFSEFMNGEDIGHEGLMQILYTLIRIRDGKKIFFEGIERGNHDVEKWRRDWNYVECQGYEYEQRCDKCKYFNQCKSEGTIIKTVERYKRCVVCINSRKIYNLHNEKDKISLEEGRERLRNNIIRCTKSGKRVSLIKAQTGIGKSFTYRDLVMNDFSEQKFIIALPNTAMKEEIASEFRKQGMDESELFVTPSHKDTCFPPEVAEQIQALYDRGIYDQTKRVVRAYMEENALFPDEKRRLEDYLSADEVLRKGEVRVILTTHTKLSNMSEDIVKDYTVIIDEDILTLCYFLQKREISEMTIRKALRSPFINNMAKEFFEQIVAVNDSGYHRSCDNAYTKYWNLSEEELYAAGIDENLNDLFKAQVYQKINGRVIYYYPGKLPSTKCMVLSATLDVEIYKKYFRLTDEDIEYVEEPLVAYRGKVIQYNYHFMGRNALNNKNALKCVMELVYNELGRNVPIISFKMLQSEEDAVKGIYYGKCCGSNQLIGRDIVCIGTPFGDDECYKLVAAYMVSSIKENDRIVAHRIRYAGMEFCHMAYHDPFLCRLQCYWTKSDLEQAVGRARVISEECTVIVFSSIPCEQAEYRTEPYLSDIDKKIDDEQMCL